MVDEPGRILQRQRSILTDAKQRGAYVVTDNTIAWDFRDDLQLTWCDR